jgi:peptide-methionine (S)-S-oxide reductase
MSLLRQIAAMIRVMVMLVGGLGLLVELASGQPAPSNLGSVGPDSNPVEGKDLETATRGGGCFWCVEAVYQRVDGVTAVLSGYAGGHIPNPTYEAVCTGRTGHAEVCQVTFDPEVISFEQILLIFFKSHDPTSLNRQGQDVGTQYRSVVFYHDDAQRGAAEKVIAEISSEKVFGRKKIVTEISPLPDFYPAEQYHQNYFRLHPEAAYCQTTIRPKIEKFEKLFKEQSRQQKEREAKKKKK